MIKLQTLLNEEKEAFQLEREGKIHFKINYEEGKVKIQLFNSDAPDQMIGYMSLIPPPDKDLTPLYKSGYLYVNHIYVNKETQGYGFLLYKEALKYAQKKGYRGLVSSPRLRTDKASRVWDKLKTFSDKYYDYLDIKDLGSRIKESINL